ncbi:DUF4192 domain-containing protein [Nocardia vaccinii]|uniref:DUF4192 domain-containing protein n=1 Tax=Nocardia vaccinii TaxID=1822 RepID=UPI000A03DE9A|nr:DUF4192 domain-containing protein [Nocardia vaccinii]
MSVSIPGGTARDPGEVIASVPVALGFYPSDSLVLLTLREQSGTDSRVVGLAARHDLLVPWEQLLDATAHAAAIAINDQAASVLAVIVDSTTDEIASRSRDSLHDRVVHSLVSTLACRGITVDGAWATTQIAAGSRWWSLLGPDHTGAIPDPETTALARAYRQRRGPHAIHASREHVADQLRVNPAVADRVRDTLSPPVPAQESHAIGDTAHETTPEQRRTMVAQLITRIDAVAAGGELTPPEYAEAATVLRDRLVRESMFGLATTRRAEAAQQFWALLARNLPDPDRAEAATLLAFHAYLGGGGALAILAAEAALEANPDHAVARLLDLALRTGLPPDQVRELADTGHARAREIGVRLHD